MAIPLGRKDGLTTFFSLQWKSLVLHTVTRFIVLPVQTFRYDNRYARCGDYDIPYRIIFTRNTTINDENTTRIAIFPSKSGSGGTVNLRNRASDTGEPTRDSGGTTIAEPNGDNFISAVEISDISWTISHAMNMTRTHKQGKRCRKYLMA